MFYYEHRVMSKWRPVVFATPPRAKKAEGGEYLTQNTHELTAAQAEMDLDQLFKLFNPIGSHSPLTAPDGIA